MSTTFNFQTCVFPSAGTEMSSDGAPLSSRIGIDLITGVNNLTYVMPFAGYVQSFGTGLTASHKWEPMTGVDGNLEVAFANGEYFMAQLPTVLPKVSAARFCWTLGIYPLPADGVTGNVVISAINVYLSPTPYTGPISYGTGFGIFDPTNLGVPYFKTVNACGITIPNPTASPGYYLIDNSAGVTGSWLPLDTSDSFLQPVNLIVTADISRSLSGTGESQLGLSVADFTWWVQPE